MVRQGSTQLVQKRPHPVKTKSGQKYRVFGYFNLKMNTFTKTLWHNQYISWSAFTALTTSTKKMKEIWKGGWSTNGCFLCSGRPYNMITSPRRMHKRHHFCFNKRPCSYLSPVAIKCRLRFKLSLDTGHSYSWSYFLVSQRLTHRELSVPNIVVGGRPLDIAGGR